MEGGGREAITWKQSTQSDCLQALSSACCCFFPFFGGDLLNGEELKENTKERRMGH